MKKSGKKNQTSELFVRRAVQAWLFSNGFSYRYRERETHEHGIDIQVQDNGPHHSRYFFIEVKGASSARYARSADDGAFLGVLGQIITRMKVIAPHAYYYGIGLPESIAKIAARRLPWQVAKKLLLYVFSVGKTGQVTPYPWKKLKKLQDS